MNYILDILKHPLFVAVFAAILSAFVIRWLTNRWEKRKMKIDTAMQFMANRFALASTPNLQAMNQIPCVFADHANVLEAWEVVSKNSTKDTVAKLLAEICRAAGLKVLPLETYKKVITPVTQP